MILSLLSSSRRWRLADGLLFLAAALMATVLRAPVDHPTVLQAVILAGFGFAWRCTLHARRSGRGGLLATGAGVLRTMIFGWLEAGIVTAPAALAFFPLGVALDFIGLWILCLALLTLVVRAVRIAARRVGADPVRRERVALVGANEIGERIAHALLAPAMAGRFDLVGVFDERHESRRAAEIAGLPVQAGLDPLRDLAARSTLDAIVLALPWQASDRAAHLAAAVQAIPANVLVPMGSAWPSLDRVEEREVAGLQCLMISRRPLTGVDGMIKAAEDYVIATLGLIVAAPAMAVITALILLLDGGPVLFRQQRLGFNGRPFTMFKFRTMAVDPADDGAEGTRPNDPRVTRTGRWLRAWSLDELPQLFNVLKGDMSVVGPRAHVPSMLIDERTYNETVKTYAARHRVKPGITGWAQVNGIRGGVWDVAKAHRSVALDLHYIDEWSLWLDIKIMVRTVLVGMHYRDSF